VAKKKPNPSPAPNADKNLFWAMIGLLTVAALSACFTAWACDYVVKSFQNSNTMALIITDAGIKSDDKNLEKQLSTATLTLISLRDIGLAVCIGAMGVATALIVRNLRTRKGS